MASLAMRGLLNHVTELTRQPHPLPAATASFGMSQLNSAGWPRRPAQRLQISQSTTWLNELSQ